MGDLSAHFSAAEFRCRCGRPECQARVLPSPALIEALERLRARVGMPIRITSGLRCTEHNARCGGAPRSFHMQGLAADLMVDGFTGPRLAEEARQVDDITGIGEYPNRVHVDVRPGTARVEWTGSA